VSFGGSPATVTKVAADGDSLSVLAPPGTGTVDVTVTTAAGTSVVTSADRYTYEPPTVTALSAHTASPGSTITIHGTDLSGATVVKFGPTEATFSAGNGSITATVPPGSGTVWVRVTTPAGTSATGPASKFTF
jgi:hypothetical protein